MNSPAPAAASNTTPHMSRRSTSSVPNNIGGIVGNSGCSVSTITNIDKVDEIEVIEEANPTNDDEFAAVVAIEERLEEAGDGGDSDEEGDEALLHSDSVDLRRSATASIRNENVEYEDNRGEFKGYVQLTNRGSVGVLGAASVFGSSEVTSSSDHGINDVKIPRPPSDYVEPPDPRVPYFTQVKRFTNVSKLSTRKGATYGHRWKLTTSSQLVHFYGILLRDGVKGGTQGAIHIRW